MTFFGIGLAKTGTASLRFAMIDLGFKVSHHDGGWIKWLARKGLGTDRNAPDLIIIPNVAMFEYIDKSVEGAKFIFTTREKEAWLESAFNHFSGPASSAHNKIVRYQIFGCLHPSRQVLSKVYDNHHAAVSAYFQDSNRLLRLDIPAGDGWEKLCPFVGRNAVEESFPHRNRKT